VPAAAQYHEPRYVETNTPSPNSHRQYTPHRRGSYAGGSYRHTHRNYNGHHKRNWGNYDKNTPPHQHHTNYRGHQHQTYRKEQSNTPDGVRFWLVLDFEATCEEEIKIKRDKTFNQRLQEIIEFPVSAVDVESHCVVATFHQYVRPKRQPILTPFCTKLTGITQNMVDEAQPITTVMEEFMLWTTRHGFTAVNSCIVTCGDWDLKTCWPRQASIERLRTPALFKRWTNIKLLFAAHFRERPMDLMHMLDMCGHEHVGRHHSGIDDVRNIANCFLWLLKHDPSSISITWGKRQRDGALRLWKRRANKIARRLKFTGSCKARSTHHALKELSDEYIGLQFAIRSFIIVP